MRTLTARAGACHACYFCHSGSLVACNDMHWNQPPSINNGGLFDIVTSATKADIVYNNITDSGGGGILVVAGFEDLTESAGLVANNLIQRFTGSGVEVGECQLPVVIVDNVVVHGVKVSDNVIGQGSAGHGILCWDAPATVCHNTVQDISGGWGGMWFAGGSPTIERNTLARCDGGGIVCSPGMELTAISPTIDGNTLDSNYAAHGGAILLDGVCGFQSGENYIWPEIKNNLFIHNRASAEYDGPYGADQGGGAIYCRDSEATVVNNTFVENLVGDGTLTGAGWTNVSLAAFGGAVHVTSPNQTNRQVTLINNIFYDNGALYGKSVACTEDGVASISYCDAYAEAQPSAQPEIEQYHYAYATGGEYQIIARPLYLPPGFFDSANAAYWLSVSSLLREDANRGQSHNVNSAVPLVDILGHARDGSQYTDMGAFESVPGNYP